MNFTDLHQEHFQRLVDSFGIANALSYYWDDRENRAFGEAK